MKYQGGIAPHWRNLGVQLLQEKYTNKLDIIQENHRGDIERCCTEMLKHWLNVDTKASWDKLIDALEKIEQNSLAEKIKEDIIKEDKGIRCCRLLQACYVLHHGFHTPGHTYN